MPTGHMMPHTLSENDCTPGLFVIVYVMYVVFNKPLFVGDILRFMTNQLFTFRRIVDVNGESLIDCVVLTLLGMTAL